MDILTEREAGTECSLSRYYRTVVLNTLQQQSPDVQWSNPLWVLKTVEANQPHDTTPPLYPYYSAHSSPSKCGRSLCPTLYVYKHLTICMPKSCKSQTNFNSSLLACFGISKL